MSLDENHEAEISLVEQLNQHSGWSLRSRITPVGNLPKTLHPHPAMKDHKAGESLPNVTVCFHNNAHTPSDRFATHAQLRNKEFCDVLRECGISNALMSRARQAFDRAGQTDATPAYPVIPHIPENQIMTRHCSGWN